MTGNTTTYGEKFVFKNGSVGSNFWELRRGDYVDLGDIKAGTTLDFSLVANGFNSRNPSSGYRNLDAPTYYADADRNANNFQSVIAYQYQDYLILAWEDIPNGPDTDYNDIVFAIDIGATNLDRVPNDPSTNRSPAAVEDIVTTPNGQSLSIDVMANDEDPDGDSISLTSIDDSFSEGTVSIGGNKVNYIPKPGFDGTDTFTYTITDTNQATGEATVTVTVEKNAAKATNDTLSTPEDVNGTLNVLTNDARSSDNSALSVKEVNGIAANVDNEIELDSGAKITINANGDLTYDPNGKFNQLNDGETSKDSFSYSIDDGKGSISTATVNVTIRGVTGNSLPDAVDDNVKTFSNKNKNIFVLDNDFDPDEDRLKIIRIGDNNDLYRSNGNPKNELYTLKSGAKIKLIKIGNEKNKNYGKYAIQYRPSESQSEITREIQDSFTYSIDDGQGGEDTATVTVTLKPVTRTFAD